jgi:SpoVK/Ycf46/Vps4 family AAA+-type ATPase
MWKEYRLINDFKKQTLKTIWKHLDAMAVNYAVYSSHLKGLAPYLTDFDVYLYCDNSSMVVVCLDCCGHCEEQTYEESETLSPLILSDGHDPRVSKVWKLAQTVRSIGNQLMIPVYGVLISEADITNAYELYKMWDSNNVTVIDYMKRLKSRKIRVNEDEDLACKSYVYALNETPLQALEADCPETETPLPIETNQEETSESDDDEFERLLNEFINNECVDFSEKDLEEGQDADPEYSSEESNPETSEDETPSEDDSSFPNGEIEQNQNLSVKVEILRPIPNPREELDKLVGCSEIKQRMDELVKLTYYNKMMHELCPTGKQHAVSLHSLFLGRPGTGKTTVCKIYGSLLRQAGALSKGHVVVCDRGTFIGTLWGDEERSARQVLEMAKGGVLMIDEAYLLNSSNPHDPGKMVIPLLMNILADESQRDIAVVLCGYKEPMQKLIDLNPGLQSRFPNKFEFPDFTIDELLEITKLRIKEYNYTFTPEAWKKYVSILSSAYQTRDPQTWGNARYIGNQLERIYIQHASRCVKQRSNGKSMLFSLTPEDIVPIEVPRPKNKIGF